jgi:hypothetical protein
MFSKVRIPVYQVSSGMRLALRFLASDVKIFDKVQPARICVQSK